MRVNCLQENLQHGLSQVARAVATRTSFPALSNVSLSTDQGRLRIAATDMNISITTWVGASIEEEGSVAVDARLLTDFVSTLPNDTVNLESEKGGYRLTVQSGRDHAEINGIDPEDFPVIPSVPESDTTISIAGNDLREMIGQVEFSAATDESRPVLAGIQMRFAGSRLTLAAADGFRLSVREGRLDSPVAEDMTVIVPAKGLREVGRLIGDSTDPVVLHVTPSQGQLIAKFGNVEFLSRLIDGRFPDVGQIIPLDFTTKGRVSRDALMTAVKRSSFFARDNNDAVRMNLKASDDGLETGVVEVTANAAERGNSESFVEADVTGPDLKVAFSSRYLNDVLGAVRAPELDLLFNGSNQAGVIRVADSDEFTHVIMPMIIGSN